MRKAQFAKLVESLKGLTADQMEQLRAAISTTQAERSSIRAIETSGPLACRHCGSLHVVRNGTRNGLQRILCQDLQEDLQRSNWNATLPSQAQGEVHPVRRVHAARDDSPPGRLRSGGVPRYGLQVAPPLPQATCRSHENLLGQI